MKYTILTAASASELEVKMNELSKTHRQEGGPWAVGSWEHKNLRFHVVMIKNEK